MWNELYNNLGVLFYPCPWICLLIFKERGREGEREKYQCERETSIRLSSVCAPIRVLTYNLGMCSDGKSNSQPFGVCDDAPTN